MFLLTLMLFVGKKEWNMNEMRGQDEMLWVKHLKTFSVLLSCKFSVNQQL
jgi:hypothetical protein